MLYAGIDGGQTGTQAVVGDERGAILGRGSAGPADEIGQSAQSTRLRDALEGALAAALRDAKLPADVRFENIVAGVSGYNGRIYGVAPAFNANDTQLVHDAPIAHAGAFDGEPGVVVIVGTGSVAYGVAKDGSSVTVGGWGYLFGDEGSAFGIARAALQRAMRAEDRGKFDAVLLATARRTFKTESLHAFVRAVYAGEIARDAVAGFARPVVALAAVGDKDARDVVLGQAAMCAELARTCARRAHLRAPGVAFVGGLPSDPYYARALVRALKREAPALVHVEPARSPVEGALLLALRPSRTTTKRRNSDGGS